MRQLAFLLSAVVVLLAFACSSGSPSVVAPIRTLTTVPGATPAPTQRSEVASSTLVPPVRTITAEPPCNDPYVDGAPYVPTPGFPIHLLPQGEHSPLEAYDVEPPVHDARLQQVVVTSLGDEADRVAVVIKNLDDGSGIMLDPDRDFYAASLYKTWVMLEAFNQQDAALLDWHELYIVSEYYESFGLNLGELQACDVVTLGDVLDRMMGRTDNVAANILLERVGAGNINRTLRSLGLSVTGFVDEERLPTTAREMALLLEAIYEGEAINEAASEQMLEALGTESIDDRIPALLPPGTQVAHKTGNWKDATHDAGIVLSEDATYIIVVLTDFGYFDDGATLIAELSLAVHDYYNS